MAKDEFARRRRQLMRLMGRDSIAILPAAPVRHRNNDVEYPYRQDSDFHYLTGFGEPEAVAVLRSEEHTSELQSRGHIVCRLLLEKKKKTEFCSSHLSTHL